MMIKPIGKHYDDHRRTSRLYFDDHPTMECHMRGGICWPIQYEENGQLDTNGYAIMAGMDVKTGVVYVFEQEQWVSIDNIINPEDGSMRYVGLSHWFNRVWQEYFGSSFFFHQNFELARRYRLQIYRSPMVYPNPKFKLLPPTDAHDMVSTIWRYVKEGRLKYERGQILDSQLMAVKSGDKQVLPAVHALGCLLAGLDRYPWREPFERPLQDVFVRQ